jgi:hypothetical protein
LSIEEIQASFDELISSAARDSVWGEGLQNDCLLTGWVLVAEWIAPDGSRQLSRGWSAATTEWQRRGMLDYAMDESWWSYDEEDEPGAP